MTTRLWLVAFAVSVAHAQGSTTTPQSARLRALSAQIQSGRAGAVTMFWGEVGQHGAPLIESIPGDTSKVLVTFLYHGDSATRNVVLFRGVNVTTNLADNPLALLPGTDVWFRSYPVRRDGRFTYLIGVNVDLSAGPSGYMRQLTSFTTDPLNPLRDPALGDPPPKHPPPFYVHSAVDLPAAPPQPWIVHHANVPAGVVHDTTFHSTLMGNERELSVYTPPGFSGSAGPYGLLVVYDGDWYLTLVPTPTILDNLIAARKIPPLVAVFVNNPGNSRDAELRCNRTFVDFLTTELIPWLHKRYAVAIDPARTVVAGSSAGGLGASCAALLHPEQFGNVLSMSGAYQAAPAGESGEWATRQFSSGPKLPVRFYVAAGLLENTTAILPSNQRFRDVLIAKGYDIQYAEFTGGHEYRNWRGVLSDGLIALFSPHTQ
jgi:enterochelin esterase family protein